MGVAQCVAHSLVDEFGPAGTSGSAATSILGAAAVFSPFRQQPVVSPWEVRRLFTGACGRFAVARSVAMAN